MDGAAEFGRDVTATTEAIAILAIAVISVTRQNFDAFLISLCFRKQNSV
jgi:hypothetical protein